MAETAVGGLAEATARLRAAGCDTPRLDAELLLAEVLGVDRTRLLLDGERPLEAAVRARFELLLVRREAREPVAYILGRRWFRSIELIVDPRVLIPRPETELLVEAALELTRGCSVLDIGTGSGAVALALAAERPDLRVRGVDLSPGAVEVAAANADRLRLPVEFVAGDLLPPDCAPDAVLANLPYVADRTELPPEIARYEPPEALFGGPDGLDVVRRLVAMLPESLGFVALEVGEGQARAVAMLLEGFERVQRLRDLAGIERVVLGHRRRM
ncbi:MAG TPA: peptide chain release factor N(5)-glutamine methyltransferase [Solirubrobacteraceae bacterium]|nr:peptide chain release factor N(5)-glutamine methyltransferase [Solirubrobacteraceae bacterium]